MTGDMEGASAVLNLNQRSLYDLEESIAKSLAEQNEFNNMNEVDLPSGIDLISQSDN
jgi:hypothetical protein